MKKDPKRDPNLDSCPYEAPKARVQLNFKKRLHPVGFLVWGLGLLANIGVGIITNIIKGPYYKLYGTPKPYSNYWPLYYSTLKDPL